VGRHMWSGQAGDGKGANTVQVGAIIVLGERGSFGESLEYEGFAKPKTEPLEWLMGTPIAALELLGQSALQRMVAYLQHVGVQVISLVTQAGLSHLAAGASGCGAATVLLDQSVGTWFVLERVLDEYIKNGLEIIVLIRLGAYVEFEFTDLLQFHRDKGQPVTRVRDNRGPLDFWMIDATHFGRATTQYPETTRMAVTGSVAHYDRATYVNRLLHAGDVRHLVVDAFGARHSIRPSGRETKPGVWLDDHARLHSRARVEGPAYIGRGTRVEATALIARFSSVERYCHIDCGTVVADSSILAHTYLGAWLDVSHAVVCGSRVAHLRHNVTVDIQDDRLIRKTSVFQRASPLFRGATESSGWLRSAAGTSKPQRSVIRAARALFLAKGTQ
jgi:hypothetical protein